MRYDENNWIKCGLEFVDGNVRMSAVVTRNGYSDWSTMAWPTPELFIRLYFLGRSFIVEVSSDGEKWSFVRICHVEPHEVGAPELPSVGLYAGCPIACGATMEFSYLKFVSVDGFHHTT
jgi:uncharacterized protein